jgi:hypothetical protein
VISPKSPRRLVAAAAPAVAAPSAAGRVDAASAFLTGTQARVTYRRNGQDLYLYWDNPYFGSNKYHCDAPRHMVCRLNGGGGRGARVRFELRYGG